MAIIPLLALLLALAPSSCLRGQVLDSPPADSQPGPGRSVSGTKLVPNFLCDEKQIWTFPLKLGLGKHWIPATAFVGATAAVVALDPVTAPISAALLRSTDSTMCSQATPHRLERSWLLYRFTLRDSRPRLPDHVWALHEIIAQ
jgi:hypothetical protein